MKNDEDPIENGHVNSNKDPMILASVSTTIIPQSIDPVNESNEPVDELCREVIKIY